MKISIRRALSTTLMLVSVMVVKSTAKPWRGLTPTRSTQLDAARVVPQCVNTSTRCTFRLEDSEVMIIFSGGDTGDGKCAKIPVGTVLAIKIRFTRLQQFEDFKVNHQQVILFDPSTPPNSDYQSYYYREEGLIVSTFRGKVFEVVYIARQRDLRRCPEYYDDPKGFVEMSAIY